MGVKNVRAGRRGALKSAPVACRPRGGYCVCVCVCLWWARGEEWEEKSAGMQPNPLGYTPPFSPFSVAHCSPNDTSLLLYNRMIPAPVTKGQAREEDTDGRSQYARARLRVEERCRRYCWKDGRRWPVSRPGLYHFPVAFYFNTGKSS